MVEKLGRGARVDAFTGGAPGNFPNATGALTARMTRLRLRSLT